MDKDLEEVRYNMDKDLEEIQNFANYLNSKPEERPFKRSIEKTNEMFSSGTKKIKSKMQVTSATSMVMGGSSKKN